jgi:threonine synthase
MRYVSTRGQAPELTFEEAMLTGLARDGGLYVPAELPVWRPTTSPRWPGCPTRRWRSG